MWLICLKLGQCALPPMCRWLSVWLALSGAVLPVSAAEIGSEQIVALRGAVAGDVVQLGDVARSHSHPPWLPLQVNELSGPQFLISDHPEYFRSNGIALQEEVKPWIVRNRAYLLTARRSVYTNAIPANINTHKLNILKPPYPRIHVSTAFPQ